MTAGPGNRYSTIGQKSGGSLTGHCVKANPFYSEFAGIKRLAGRDKGGIGIAVRQVHIAIVGTEDRCGDSGAVVPRMPHIFEAKLVIADLAEDVGVTLRDEMVGLVHPRDAGEGDNSFFRDQVIEFELT